MRRAAGSQHGLPLFRRAGRVYVALDRDATDRAIALARTFGTRGRVLIPPEDLGPKGDLNDWLRVGAKGDPATFRSILERALAMSPTPWALQIQRLPSDLAPWDLEDHIGVRELLCELGHQDSLCQGPMGIVERTGVPSRAARWSVWKTCRARSRSPQGSGLRPRCAPLTALVAATVFPLWPASRLSLMTPSCSVSQYTHVSLHHAKQSPGVP